MKIYALTTAILLTASAFGAKISYDYDKAGNRIKRWLVVEEITNTTEAEFNRFIGFFRKFRIAINQNA